MAEHTSTLIKKAFRVIRSMCGSLYNKLPAILAFKVSSEIVPEIFRGWPLISTRQSSG